MTREEIEMRIYLMEKMLLQLKKDLQQFEKSGNCNKVKKKVEVSDVAKEVLEAIGVKKGLNGYDYLLEEIIEKIENPSDKLYCNTCKKFSKKYSAVERAIRTIKLNVFKNKKKTLARSLFQECKEVPTNKKFIQILIIYTKKILNSEEEIKKIIKLNEEELDEDNAFIKSVIYKCLNDVGIDLKLKGYDYLAEEIIARIEQPYCKLYVNAAQKYSTSYYNVNINIRNAKIKAFEKEHKNELLENLFQDYSLIPSNKEFINVLTNYVEERVSM